MTTLYISSAVNPLAHLRGLPVAVVNQDPGAAAGSQDLELGRQVQAGLLASPAVSGRLHLEVLTLPQAEAAMSRDALYAALVIPRDFTASLLTVSGLHAAGPAAAPQVQMPANQRAGTVGTSLVTGILQPALAAASRQIGQHLAALAPPGARTGAAKPPGNCRPAKRPPTAGNHGPFGKKKEQRPWCGPTPRLRTIARGNATTAVTAFPSAVASGGLDGIAVLRASR